MVSRRTRDARALPQRPTHAPADPYVQPGSSQGGAGGAGNQRTAAIQQQIDETVRTRGAAAPSCI
jgi:hypothetical protein